MNFQTLPTDIQTKKLNNSKSSKYLLNSNIYAKFYKAYDKQMKSQ